MAYLETIPGLRNYSYFSGGQLIEQPVTCKKGNGDHHARAAGHTKPQSGGNLIYGDGCDWSESCFSCGLPDCRQSKISKKKGVK